jgi:hypothetical protein
MRAQRAAIALYQDVEISSGLGRLKHTEGVFPSRHGQINGIIERDLKEDPRVQRRKARRIRTYCDAHLSARFSDLELRRRDDVLGGEAEPLLQFLQRRRGTKRLHADAMTAVAEIPRPAEG